MKVKKVWVVLENIPYEGDELKDVCVNKEVADYVRDWYDARQEDLIHDACKKHGEKFRLIANRNDYYVEEHEVLK